MEALYITNERVQCYMPSRDVMAEGGCAQGGSGVWGCLRQQHPLPTPQSECTVGIKCVVPKQKKSCLEWVRCLHTEFNHNFEQRKSHVQFTSCHIFLHSTKILSPKKHNLLASP